MFYCLITISFFICKHISFQAKLLMLIVDLISPKILGTICLFVDSKMGSNITKCSNQSIWTNCVSFLSDPISS